MSSAAGLLQIPPGERLTAAIGRVALSAAFVAGLAVSAGAALPVAAQEGSVSFSTAEAAPADAITYVVTTTDDQSEQWQLADALLDRAGFGEAIDQAVAEEFQDESGQDLPLDAFLGGEVAVVLSSVALDTLAEESMGGGDLDAMLAEMGMATPEAESTEPEAQGFAVVLDTAAPDTAWAGIRESAEEDAPQESTYEGTTIIYTPPATDEDEGMAAAKVGDHILIATAPADLHPLIDTIDGRTPNITTVPEFTTAREALPAEFLTFSFTNSLADLDVDLGPFGAMTEGLITDSYSASTIAADAPGFRIESVTLPAADASLPTPAASFQSELVGAAPADSVIFMSGPNLGETGVLDALGAGLLGLAFGMGDPSMMGGGTPEPDASPEEVIAKQYEDAAALIGVNLQTDLFQQFVGEYGGWLTADPAAEQVSGLWSSQLSDADTVSNALMQLSFLIQGASGSETPLTTREVGGGQVYVIELGDEAGSTLEFGVVGDRFVIGNGDAIDRLSGDAADPLSGNEQFQAVMATLPAEGNGTFYVDLVQAIPLMEVASEQTEDLGMGDFGEITDASETCANYTTQEEAQAAYDAAEPDTFDLDQDFDGQACEDFFAAADTGDEVAEEDAASEVEEAFANVDYSAIQAFAVVSHAEDGVQRSSGILYIAE
jgi:hypothetical protein